jgi:hypothetical protein
MTAPTLSARQLNRALLARQLLLKRARLPIPAALDQLAGIQNQYAPNAYIRLWSCLAGFGRDDLTKAYESSAVVQGTLMRGTIHTVSAADYHPLVAAIREPRQAWSRRIHKDDDADRAEALARVRKGLERPLNRAQYLELLKGASRAVQQTIDTDAEILRVPPSGTWARRRAHIYGLADNYIDHRDVDAEAGRAQLVRRYLAGFGPSTPDEIATFCGIPLTTLRPTIEAMDLRPFQDEAGAKMVDVPDGELHGGHARAGALLADLGRNPSGPRTARGRAARGVSAADLSLESAAVVPDVPRRRQRRRHLALGSSGGQGRHPAIQTPAQASDGRA